jgi:capsular polysaccharide biosynthesis protein
MKIIKEFYPAVKIKRNPPANLRQGDEVYFGGPEFTYVTPPSALLHYKNAVVTQDGIIIKNLVPQKKLIVSYERDFRKYKFRYLAHVFLKDKKVVLPADKKYMLIFDNYSGPKGLAHWYSDSLTRLVEVKDILDDFVALVPYYYKTNAFIFESLQLLGIKNIYCIEKDTRVSVRDLYVPEHIAESGNFNPENTAKLRQFMWDKNADKLQFSLGPKLYISRSRAAFRFVENEKEVTETLAEYGFKVVFMEDYNLSQKVSMVYNADHMVGIIGAAFSFVHFMRPGSSLMEFRNEGSHNSIYFSLADAMGMAYYYQVCETKMNDFESQNFDLKVDIPRLRKNIEQMLAK